MSKDRQNSTVLRRLRLFLAVGVVLFVGTCAYIGALLVARQAALDPHGRSNVTWLIAQAPSEVARLEQRISAIGLGGSHADLSEVQIRFDVAANRLNVLRSGFLAAFMASSKRNSYTLAQFASALDQIRPLIPQLADREVQSQALDLLSPIYPRLVRMSVDANHWNAARIDRERNELNRLQQVFVWTAIGLMVAGLLFIVLLLLHNRLLSRTSDQLRRKDEALQTRTKWFSAALNNMTQGLCLTDSAGKVLVCNDRFVDLFRLRAETNWTGVPLARLVPAQLLPGRDMPKSNLVDGTDQPFRLDNGTVIQVSHERLVGGGWVSTYQDISERHRAQERIVHMAHHDPLTGLPNRNAFWQRTEQVLDKIGTSNAEVAVLYLDLDSFKEVNDTLGHPAGDALLRAVAARLTTVAGAQAQIARLGGDEFALMMTSAGDVLPGAVALVERVLESLSQPYDLGDKEVNVTTCAGIAIAPRHGTSSDELIKKADLALYQSKAAGPNTYRCFEPEMEATLMRRRRLADDLRTALELDQIHLQYQPLVSLDTMKIVAGEALLRWTHPELGAVSPAEFIPLAEETGIINEMGDWALRRAFHDARLWPDHVRVSVNLSPVQFRSAELHGRVAMALQHSGLAAHRVELEITESVLLQETTSNLQTLQQLRALGVSIALDDFGTGYSSLSYLLKFPFDKIKIDQSFVRGMDSTRSGLAIVRSIAQLARRLQMSTTAEGVETYEQLNTVMNAGCTEAQGYYFSRPLPEAEFRHAAMNNLGHGEAGRAIA